MKKYLITSREFYTDTPAVFYTILQEQIQKHSPDYVLYRDKSNPNYEIQAEYALRVCSQFQNVKCFIHQDIDLAKKLGADGVHLTSNQFDRIKEAKSKGLEVTISTHSYEEVKKAQKLKVDFVTYSPIFNSPNKGEPKGVDDLQKILEKTSIKIFALGGIIDELHIKKLQNTKVYGFASIRYFY